MTLEELCEKYGYASSSVIHGFPRVRDNILKVYGVLIIKEGKGKKAVYKEENKQKEQQIKELQEFLEKNPHAQEYLKELK